MKLLMCAPGVVAMMACAAWLSAEEFTSGVDVDGKIGAYRTVKVAGCEDGVKEGKSLCYT